MLNKLRSGLLNVIEARLDPLEPISLLKTWRHLYTLPIHAVLERLHPMALILGDIVPAEVNAPIILTLDIVRHNVFAVGHKVVKVGRRDIHRILAVVARIVGIVGVGLIHRLLQFFKILLISPLFVPVAATLIVIFRRLLMGL